MQWKRGTFVMLLAGLAVVGPLVAYAGIQVIYPKSTQTVNVNTSPPITFTQGGDYATANALGFASAFTQIDNNAAFTITLSGLSGGNVTIDNYTMLTENPSVAGWKFQVADALSGTIDGTTELAVLRLRVWEGATPPTADGSAGVCAVLNLESPASTESTGTCNSSTRFYKLQVVYELLSNSAGSSTLSIRPSSITFS